MSKRRGKRHTRTTLRKKAQKGFRGYPIATVAYYGPDDQFASKVAVGILLQEGEDAAFLERWFSQGTDVRADPAINREIVEFIGHHRARSVVVTDGIIGCPHEEGIDYPKGESCPECPFWANRDRWTGELIGEKKEGLAKPGVVAGCAWYRAEQWERLREISVDRDRLEDTYEEWLIDAQKGLQHMQEAGMSVEKVEVDVEELLAWCRAHNQDVDGKARAAYAAEMLRRRHQGDSEGDGG